MTTPHVLVTGGAGFIGSHLVDRLLAAGKRVVVIDDGSTGRFENLAAVAGNPALRIINARVSACAELDALAGGAEVIYHLAAAVGVELVIKAPIQSITTNLGETEAVMAVADKHRVPILVTSTSEVYGKSQKSGFAEGDDLIIGPPKLIRWSYACSKLMDEFLAMAYAQERGLPVVVARLFNTVGPRQTGRFGMVLPRFIAAAKADVPIRVYGDGRQTRCFCYVADTVESLLRLMDTPAAKGEVFNVGTDEEVTIHQLAELVIRTLNSKSAIELVPYDQAYQPGFEDMMRRRPVIEKLARVTGFRPSTPLTKIIELTAATL
jgi:UDP-glucose 4-epimerase